MFDVDSVDDFADDRDRVGVTLMLRDVDLVYDPVGVTVRHAEPVGVTVPIATVGVSDALIVEESESNSDAPTDTVGVDVEDSVEVVETVFVIDGEPDADGVTEFECEVVAVTDCDPDTDPHRDAILTETDGLREFEFVAELDRVDDSDPETELHREPPIESVCDREYVGDVDWENESLDVGDTTAEGREEVDTVNVPDWLVVDVCDGVPLFVTVPSGVDEMLADTQIVPEFVGVRDAEDETDGDGENEADAEPLTDTFPFVLDGVKLVVDEKLTSLTLGDDDAGAVRDSGDTEMEGEPVNVVERDVEVVIERDGDVDGDPDTAAQRGGVCNSSHTPELQSLSTPHTALRSPASSRARSAHSAEKNNIKRRRRILDVTVCAPQ